MIFSKDNDKLIALMAMKNKLDVDDILSAYAVVGDDALLLLHIFEGKTVRFPSSRRLGCESLHSILFIEDDARKYADYKRHNIIEINDKEYEVVYPERLILNHWYLPVVLLEDDDGVQRDTDKKD